MRRDARDNRDRLIAAGKRLMQELGGNLAVEQVCALAGVTRGTFYRHFSDRADLYGAVLDFELRHMAEQLEDPTLEPLAFLRILAEMTMLYDRFLALLPDMADYPEGHVNEDRILATITPAFERAKAGGHLRHDIQGRDILIACRMIGSDWRMDRQPSRSAAMEKRLALLLRGLC